MSDAADHIADQRTALDTLATQFSTELNAAHQAGLDANGNPGAALLNLNGGAAAMVAVALAPDDVAAANGASMNGNILAFNNLRGPGALNKISPP